jgi:hypothetical protein
MSDPSDDAKMDGDGCGTATGVVGAGAGMDFVNRPILKNLVSDPFSRYSGRRLG